MHIDDMEKTMTSRLGKRLTNVHKTDGSRCLQCDSEAQESFSSASYSKWDDDRARSSQEWKTEIKTYERSGRPDKTSWKMIRKVRPGHEEILLDGTAQSVRERRNTS